MPRHYPAELRRQTCERMLAGEAVKDLTAELGIAGVTLYKWRGAGVVPPDARVLVRLQRSREGSRERCLHRSERCRRRSDVLREFD